MEARQHRAGGEWRGDAESQSPPCLPLPPRARAVWVQCLRVFHKWLRTLCQRGLCSSRNILEQNGSILGQKESGPQALRRALKNRELKWNLSLLQAN